MGKKLTIEEMRAIAKARGGKCLSNVYVNSDTKLEWRCAKGHVWEAKPDNIKYNDRWCPHCAHNVRLTIQEARETAKSRGGKCLSKKYVNAHTKLEWQCRKGHVWKANSNNIRNGKWCPECAHKTVGMKQRLTIGEMREVAESRGGTCLSDTYVNSDTKLKWQCNNGHVWEAVPNSVKHGTWCPYCANTIKLTIDDMRKIAHARGGVCLSDEYVNQNAKLKWRCKEGHVWKSSSVRGGSWCPECYNKLRGMSQRLNIEEMKEIAKSRSGKCLSDAYVNAIKKLKWQCREGHEWENRASNVRRGEWCPICSQHISERVCHKYFENMFGKKFLHVRPRWLVTSHGTRLELDGYCEELKLAFEYQGKQHYEHVRFFHNEANFEKRRRYDRLKRKLCELNGVVLIEIPFNIDTEKIGEYILQQCEKRGIVVPNRGVNLESFDFYYPEKMKELREIANSKDGKLLSLSYIGSQTPLKWQCCKGHIWKSRPDGIRSGKWCPYCAQRVKLTIEEMRKMAQSRGGKCMSKRYDGAFTKLKWRCKEGHVWDAEPSSLKNQKTWCPYCSHRVKLTIQEMRNMAKSRGGKCLSNKYVNTNSKLRWRCKKGHVWGAVPSTVKIGKWCPYCAGNAKLTIEEMRKMAEVKGGKCLSEKYSGIFVKLKWQCGEGHEWLATPQHIREGSWCPKCWSIRRVPWNKGKKGLQVAWSKGLKQVKSRLYRRKKI